MAAKDPFARFVEVVAALRHPETGCPWDLEQTHRSIRPYLIEETYEVIDAIDAETDKELKEELGDVLLQVVLHAQIAKDRNAFTIDDIAESITEKMIRRHPHVFGEAKVSGSQQVLQNWEQIKSQEKSSETGEQRKSILDGVPKAMPQLTRAQRLGEKASRVGFEWASLAQVWEKVEEELEELKTEIARAGEPPAALTTAPSSRPKEIQAALENEFGDLLFSLCQLGRWLGVGSEDSLRGAIEKFLGRFQDMEQQAGKPLRDQTPEELDALWEQAKMRVR